MLGQNGFLLLQFSQKIWCQKWILSLIIFPKMYTMMYFAECINGSKVTALIVLLQPQRALIKR